LAEPVCRTALESALLSYAPANRESFAQTFLEALSLDELLFLADFLGSCILITSAINMHTWDAICHQAHAWQRRRETMSPAQRQDAGHKILVLSQFAESCGFVIRLR
jgi:hypothetical protein